MSYENLPLESAVGYCTGLQVLSLRYFLWTTLAPIERHQWVHGVVVEYRTCNREVADSTHTRSTASNLEQVANLLYAQANSASYPQRDGK